MTVNTIVKATDIIDVDHLEFLVKEGWINKRSHPVYPYDIYCYSKKTEYANNWGETVNQARGLILDNHTGEVIARPFDKFFNLGQEHGLKIEDIHPETKIHAYDKMDGVLAISYLSPDGELKWSSKGSFTSEFAHGMNKFFTREEIFQEWTPDHGQTLMCEYVGPNSKIVLDYDKEDLVLLGARDIATGNHIMPENANWAGNIVPKMPFATIKEAIDNWNVRENVEGQVVTIADGEHAGEKVKLKTDEYFNRHWLTFFISKKKVFEHVYDLQKMEKKDDVEIQDFIGGLPDEFHDKVRNMVKEINDYAENEINERIAFAEQFSEIKNMTGREKFEHLTSNGIPKNKIGEIISINNGNTRNMEISAWRNARKLAGD